MAYIPPGFVAATLKDEDKYEGKDVDMNVTTVLPAIAKIEWVSTHGASHWAISTKIETSIRGEKKTYFLKEYRDVNSAGMARGEYEAMSALHNAAPGNIPKPVGYGTYASDSSKSFFLQEFRDMSDELPDTDEFVALVAKIHQQESPNGKFGFHIQTFRGNIPNHNGWCDTWEELFTRILRDTLAIEKSIHGANEELEELAADTISKVVPRLLRPLETEGNKVKPVLLHADLWHGNVGVDNETDEPVLYDAGSFYGHGEYEAATWRATRYRTNRVHLRAYHRLVAISEPAEDHDDRNALYAMRNDLMVSCCWSQNKLMRQLAMKEMRRLVAKYPNGYEGYMEMKQSQNAKA